MMNNIYVPSQGPQSWQQFLAEPAKHWKTGYSAKSMAHCWEEADGFPASIQQALDNSAIADLTNLQPLVIIPEHKVPLPGGRTQSQNDAFVLARNADHLAAIMIEGKVEESFGQPVKNWGPDTSPGKQERFAYLVDLLGLQDADLDDVYYQLLHRTASAIIEAQRFHASTAIMLVHSFSQQHTWFAEYAKFAVAMGAVDPQRNSVNCVGERHGVMLYLGWVTGEAEYLQA
jgi:hypothetical protein